MHTLQVVVVVVADAAAAAAVVGGGGDLEASTASAMGVKDEPETRFIIHLSACLFACSPARPAVYIRV